MPKSVNAMDVPGADPDPPVSSVGPKERAIIEELVRALQGIDIDGLPEGPRGDTLRGLQWALESLVSPQVEPRTQHRVPLNIRLTKRELRVGQAAMNAAWEISSFVLTGLQFLRPRGYVSRWGAEVPAMWSPGDFRQAVESARAALVDLEALNDKLNQLKVGGLSNATL